MNLIIEGILWGLTLAILTGPLFITLVNTSIKRGVVEGMVVGSGIWVSDILIIILAYSFTLKYASEIEGSGFKFWLGIGGGILLILIGFISYISKVDNKSSSYPQYLRYIGYWSKGFAINTFNPFTFIFWFGMVSTYMIGRSLPSAQVVVFLTTILGVIIITDILKVLAADKISQYLDTKYIGLVQKFAGVVFVVSGVLLIIRSI